MHPAVMNVPLKTITLATLLSLNIGMVHAGQMYQGDWYVLPGASSMRTDDQLDAKQHGGGFFIKLGKELSPDWDVQGGFTYNRVAEDTGIAGVGGHYKQITLGADVLYLFSRQALRPFLLIGGGVARNNVDYSNLPGLHHEMRTSWMGNAGLGAQWIISDRFGVQVDWRRQWSKSDAHAPGTSVDTSGTIANDLFNVGGMWRFGASSPAILAANDMPPPNAPVTRPMPPATQSEPRTTVTLPVAAPPPDCKAQFETITLSAEKLFDFDKAQMREGAKPLLDDVVSKLNAHPEFELVMVTGYSDRIGRQQYNQRLSEQRANQVKDYLVQAGVASGRLKSVGKGEADPKVSCQGIHGEPLILCLQPNRRVVIEDQAQHQLPDRPGCS